MLQSFAARSSARLSCCCKAMRRMRCDHSRSAPRAQDATEEQRRVPGVASRHREPAVAPRRVSGAAVVDDLDDRATGDDHDGAPATTTTLPPDDDHDVAAADDHDDGPVGVGGQPARSVTGDVVRGRARRLLRQPDVALRYRADRGQQRDRRLDRLHGRRPRGGGLPPGGRPVARGLLTDRRPEPGSGGSHNLLVTHSGADIAQLLSAHGLRPSRALGQNFVADPNTVRRIARLAGLSAR